MSRVIFAERATIETPPSGKGALQLRASDKNLIFVDDTGAQFNITQAMTPPVYGTEFQSVSSEGSDTTTSATPVEKLKLTTSSLAGGTYRIDWYYEWSHNNGGDDFIGIVDLDDTDQLSFVRQEPKDVGGTGPGGTDQSHAVGGHAIRNLTAGIHTIDIDYYSSVGGVLSEIKNARLTLIRVA